MSTRSHVLVEVCVDSICSAVGAARGEADSVELCADLGSGGVTPSVGIVEAVRAEVGEAALNVLIRPRAGDFVFSAAEHRAMLRDIRAAREAGCNGVALGVLTPEGDIDTLHTRSLIEEARPLQVTFHRAFDLTRDVDRALDVLIELGVDRILTSGQAGTAEAGQATLARLVARASDELCIVPAGAILLSNARTIIDATGARALHVGSAVSQTEATVRGAVRAGPVQLGAVQLGAVQLGAVQLGAVQLGPGGTDDGSGHGGVQEPLVRELVRRLRVS